MISTCFVEARGSKACSLTHVERSAEDAHACVQMLVGDRDRERQRERHILNWETDRDEKEVKEEEEGRAGNITRLRYVHCIPQLARSCLKRSLLVPICTIPSCLEAPHSTQSSHPAW